MNVVITGANRGIGLSLAQLNTQRGHRVYALCRQPSAALETLSVEVITGIDVGNSDCQKKVKAALTDIRIDLLINNAGILRNETLDCLDYDTIQAQWNTNALGPLKITEALLPQLHSGSKIAMITSRMGSIEDNTSGGRYGYRMSKAALNMAAVSLAHDLRSDGIAVAMLHPGLVGTDMIGGHGNVTPDQAAERLMARIDALTLETSGTFWHADGQVLPW